MGFHTRILFALSALVLSVAPAGAQQTAPSSLPVSVFGNLPQVTDVAISPDGSKLVIGIVAADGGAAIDVVDLNTGQRTPLAHVGNRDAVRAQMRGVGWADDNRVTFALTETMRGANVGVNVRGENDTIDYFRPGVIDLSDPRVRYLSPEQNERLDRYNTGASLIAPIEGDPGFGRMIARSFASTPSRVIPFRINLASGDSRKVEVAGANQYTGGFMMNARAEVVGRVDVDGSTNHWSLYVYRNGQPTLFREGTSTTGSPDTSFIGVLPDGRIAFVDDKNDPSTIMTVNPADGAVATLYHHDGEDVGARRDPWTREIVGVGYGGDHGKMEYYDPALRDALATVDQSFPDSIGRLDSWSRDRSRIIVYREDALDGGGYYVYTPAQRQMRPIGMNYPQLAQIDLGERQSITYRARDGVRVPAYLTLPANVDRHNLPTVILVHGGPHGVRDYATFDWWSSFLVSRGYAVLQPNYRGSGGYGHEWEDAGKLHWGDGVMQTDVEDGVAALVRGGITDPHRVCIVGASYGGYAALAGATITPDLYACAISVSGVSDLESMLSHATARGGGRRGGGGDFWRASMGDPLRDMEHIRAVSPANLAARVHIPVLLIHGADDVVVPYEQSTLMEQRLRAAGKNVRLVTLQHEDHWMSDGSTRIQMLTEVEQFLAQNIGQRR